MRIATNRRQFILLASALLVSAYPANASSNGVRGCCILPRNSEAAFRTTFNRKPTEMGPVEWKQNLSRDSGISPEFESALGELLVDMAKYFAVNPGFGFYSESGSPNALAIDAKVILETNGMVAFGRKLLEYQLKLDGKGISVAAICAHEFAHILQYKFDFHSKLDHMYQPHLTELHADFLAGAYLHRLKDAREISLQGVGRAWEEMGDSQFTDAPTHGTSDMRLDSIQEGYFWVDKHGHQDMLQVANAGVSYVKIHADG